MAFFGLGVGGQNGQQFGGDSGRGSKRNFGPHSAYCSWEAGFMANRAPAGSAKSQTCMNRINLYDILCHIYPIDIARQMSYFVIYWYISMKILGIQARINENGRIVVPAVIRKGMGLKLGDSIVMSLDDGVLRIEPLRAPTESSPQDSGRVQVDRRTRNASFKRPGTGTARGVPDRDGRVARLTRRLLSRALTIPASRCRLPHQLLPEPRSQH